jgi:hypothetical protein
MILLQQLWLCILALIPLVLAADPDPTHTITSFENLPARLFFFDDTPVRSP